MPSVQKWVEALLVRALEICQSPYSLQAIVEAVLQAVGGAVPHPHRAILRPCKPTHEYDLDANPAAFLLSILCSSASRPSGPTMGHKPVERNSKLGFDNACWRQHSLDVRAGTNRKDYKSLPAHQTMLCKHTNCRSDKCFAGT